MITDKLSNTLYLSDKLEKDYSDFFNEFIQALSKNGILVNILENTRAIWCRDYMPIQVNSGKYVQFKYLPSYLKDFEDTITDTSGLYEKLEITPIISSIKLDGGNIVKSDDTVIITSRVIHENQNRAGLLDEIRTLLDVRRVIEIPAQPYDDLGHSDGMVRFLDNKTILVNNYSKTKESNSFQEKLYGVLGRHGLDIIQVPYYPSLLRSKDGIQSAMGTYINYLQIGNKVFLPFFGNEDQDEEAFFLFEKLFGKNVIPVNSNDIAIDGGVLNCITWNIQKPKK